MNAPAHRRIRTLRKMAVKGIAMMIALIGAPGTSGLPTPPAQATPRLPTFAKLPLERMTYSGVFLDMNGVNRTPGPGLAQHLDMMNGGSGNLDMMNAVPIDYIADAPDAQLSKSAGQVEALGPSSGR